MLYAQPVMDQENALLAALQRVSQYAFGSGRLVLVDAVVARQLPALSNTLISVFAMRMAAMFVFATSNIGRTTGVLPRWFMVSGFLVGLFPLLSATFNQLLVLVFPVWTLTLAILLLLRARHIPADAIITASAPSVDYR
jgi:hypothetical protein